MNLTMKQGNEFTESNDLQGLMKLAQDAKADIGSCVDYGNEDIGWIYVIPFFWDFDERFVHHEDFEAEIDLILEEWDESQGHTWNLTWQEEAVVLTIVKNRCV